MATKKAVAKASKKDVAAATMYEADADTGFEDTSQEDYAIPFLAVLQKNSPVCDEDDPRHIKGAKQGQLMNTVTTERYNARLEEEEYVEVIPCAYIRNFIEWKKREDGGGIVAVHDAAEGEKLRDQCSRDEKNRDITPDGTQLVDTRQWYILMHNPDQDEWEPIILGMSSTQLKKSKRWMTQMRNIKMTGKNGKFTPPMFSHVYHVSTITESNDQGSWRGIEIRLDRQVTDPELYQKAKDFRDMVIGGQTKAAYESTEDAAAM